MITEVNCSSDMRKALNENLYGLLTGKRKPIIVKEVNNTLGKMLNDVKMEMMQNMLSGNRNTIAWFDKTYTTSSFHIPIEPVKVAKRQRSVAT
jgi:hypothetical protein